MATPPREHVRARGRDPNNANLEATPCRVSTKPDTVGPLDADIQGSAAIVTRRQFHRITAATATGFAVPLGMPADEPTLAVTETQGRAGT